MLKRQRSGWQIFLAQ